MKAGRDPDPRMMMIMITWIVIKMTTSEKNFEKMSKMRRVKSDDE
jgi:hypothetical protein